MGGSSTNVVKSQTGRKEKGHHDLIRYISGIPESAANPIQLIHAQTLSNNSINPHETMLCCPTAIYELINEVLTPKQREEIATTHS
jgi:hypothetical protein